MNINSNVFVMDIQEMNQELLYIFNIYNYDIDTMISRLELGVNKI